MLFHYLRVNLFPVLGLEGPSKACAYDFIRYVTPRTQQKQKYLLLLKLFGVDMRQIAGSMFEGRATCYHHSSASEV